MRTQLPANANICMIIAFSLIMGVVMFGLIAVFVIAPGRPPAAEPLLAVMMAGLGVIAFLAAMIVPGVMTSAQLKQIAQSPQAYWEGSLRQLYQTRMLVRFAQLEGGAMANLVAFIVEHQNWSLLIAGWMVLTMIVFFPTPGRMHDWIREQMELLNLDI